MPVILQSSQAGYAQSSPLSHQLVRGNRSVVCEVVRDGRESPFKNIDNYESSFDNYLPYQYKKIASGWTRLTPYVYDDVPESFNFMDVMWINENFESNVL